MGRPRHLQRHPVFGKRSPGIGLLGKPSPEPESVHLDNTGKSTSAWSKEAGGGRLRGLQRRGQARVVARLAKSEKQKSPLGGEKEQHTWGITATRPEPQPPASGTDGVRTRDLRFTRPTPYHLATAPDSRASGRSSQWRGGGRWRVEGATPRPRPRASPQSPAGTPSSEDWSHPAQDRNIAPAPGLRRDPKQRPRKLRVPRAPASSAPQGPGGRAATRAGRPGRRGIRKARRQDPSLLRRRSREPEDGERALPAPLRTQVEAETAAAEGAGAGRRGPAPSGSLRAGRATLAGPLRSEPAGHTGSAGSPGRVDGAPGDKRKAMQGWTGLALGEGFREKRGMGLGYRGKRSDLLSLIPYGAASCLSPPRDGVCGLAI
ncbi:collagen alpha-1(I) chain-like [Choloepus didactylus]|uniref:collagen alpha-1(I) chain-like n=1 Tax=Choloepus didactylus TaxID=27675 RepID=UPI00189E8FB3|nr:collagen alpha-1(I) chain-like [Choloepus didactylus]